MTITKTCDRIDIASTLTTDNFSSLNYSKYEILVSVDCCEPTVLLIWEDGTYYMENFNGTTTLYVYPADLGMETFTSGLYTITLKFTNTDTNSESIETNCTFVDCGIGCEYFNTFREDVEALIDFNSLYSVEACGQCDCEKACEIWNQVKSKLYNTDADCGCNS